MSACLWAIFGLSKSYLHMELGERLKALRTGMNWSQKDLAEQTGLTLRTIQRIENNEVKPSLFSLKVLGEALQADLSQSIQQSETKPNEFNFTVKIADMNQFMTDLKALFRNHWKIIFSLILIVWLITNYTEIKSGIIDGWSGQ